MGIIRFVLALSVLVYHGQIVGLGFLNNRYAVSAFFVASGFTAAYSLSTQKYPFTRKGLQSYYHSRILRIYPLYFLALIIALGVNLALLHSSTKVPLQEVISTLPTQPSAASVQYVIENITLFNFWHSWLPYVTTLPLILLPAWTLLIEFWFYLFAPFLNRLSSKWILLVGLGSIISRYSTFHHLFGSQTLPDNQFFPNQLIYFVIGILSYRISQYLPKKHTGLRRGMLFIILLLSVVVGAFPISGAVHWGYICIFAVCLPFIQPFDFEWKLSSLLSELSYPLYVFHLPVVWIAMHFVPDTSQSLIGLLFFLLVPCILFLIIIAFDVVSPHLHCRALLLQHH